MRTVGTEVRGIRTPIIKDGDDLATIVVDSLMNAKENEGFEFRDRDVVAITEAVVGISEGNYATVDDVANDLVNDVEISEKYISNMLNRIGMDEGMFYKSLMSARWNSFV